MVEILPIKLLDDSDAPIFGSLNVALGRLSQAGLPIASGIAVTPPNLKLKTTLEHHDFGHKEIFEQSLTLVKKEIHSIPPPENLVKEVGKHRLFLVAGQVIKSVKQLWLELLNIWLDEVKERLWKDGFTLGLTEGLEPQVIVFVSKLEASGKAYEDREEDDVVIETLLGEFHPSDQKQLVELVQKANKKLLLPHSYGWILDGSIKLIKVTPYTQLPSPVIPSKEGILMNGSPIKSGMTNGNNDKTSAVKVFFDLSNTLAIERDVDGIYIASEKIFDLNKPKDSFESLVFKIVEAGMSFPRSPVLVKLADQSEGMGKVRGTLRLLHQQSLFDPLIEALDFARNKKGLLNIHLVIPFVRSPRELSEIKTKLAAKKMQRKSSLKFWLELAVPENIVNLEEYLIAGIDGVVLNLDELVAYLNGFDHTQEDLVFYKNEVGGLIKFLGDGLKLLHKSKVPFIGVGSLALYPQVLEFLVEKGVYGVVVERYEAHSAHDLLHQTERRLILRKSI